MAVILSPARIPAALAGPVGSLAPHFASDGSFAWYFVCTQSLTAPITAGTLRLS
jgi:hypothetical protein